jgi:hypothetical protein
VAIFWSMGPDSHHHGLSEEAVDTATAAEVAGRLMILSCILKYRVDAVRYSLQYPHIYKI